MGTSWVALPPPAPPCAAGADSQASSNTTPPSCLSAPASPSQTQPDSYFKLLVLSTICKRRLIIVPALPPDLCVSCLSDLGIRWWGCWESRIL